MKQAIFLTTFFCVVAITGSAKTKSVNKKENFSLAAYSDSTAIAIPSAQEMLAEIMSVTGLQANFELKEATVLNIEASISHKKRYILYNPTFLNQLTKLTRSKWAVMALLAHEVGHHLNGHTIRKSGSSPALELEADEFAGFILHKLGATLEQSQQVMMYIAKTETSATHPGRGSRMQAIQNGWEKAMPSPIIAALSKN